MICICRNDSTTEGSRLVAKLRHKPHDDELQVSSEAQTSTMTSLNSSCHTNSKRNPLAAAARLQWKNGAKCGCPAYTNGSITCTLVPSLIRPDNDIIINNNNNNTQYAKEIFANRSRSYQLTRSSKQQSLTRFASQTTVAPMIVLLLYLFVNLATSDKISAKNSLQYFKNDIERISAVVSLQHPYASSASYQTQDSNDNQRLEHINLNLNSVDSQRYANQLGDSVIVRDRRSRQQQFVVDNYNNNLQQSQPVHSNSTNQTERRLIDHRMPSINYSKYSLWGTPPTTTLIDVPKDEIAAVHAARRSSQSDLHNNNSNDNNNNNNIAITQSSQSPVEASSEHNHSSLITTVSSGKGDVSMAPSNRNTLVANMTNLAHQQQDDDIIAAAPFLESPLNSAVVSSSPSPSMMNDGDGGGGQDGQQEYGKKVHKTTLTKSQRGDSIEDATTHDRNGSNGRSVAGPGAEEALTRLSSDNQPVQRENAKKRRDGDLEAFLENMNHMELRAAAFGRPLPNSFLEKPLQESPQKVAVSAGTASTIAEEGAGGLTRMQSHHHHTNHHHALYHQQSRHKQSRESYSDCALILQRTYVRNTNHKNDIPYGKTEQACISYKDINRAVELAKSKLKFNKKTITDALTKTLEPSEPAVAAIGEVNMAVTQILADKFDLSNDEILNGLPLIDMSKTKFWKFCPLLVIPIKCEQSRFRTFTGHCNNHLHPTWGAALTPFARYLPPVHPDGIWEPRKSIITEITYELTSGHHETVANHQGLVEGHRVNADEDNNDHDHDHHHSPTHHSDDGEQAAASASVYTPHFPGKSRPLELPSARLVTSVVHRDINLPSHEFSILFMSWGQLLDHDMSRAAQLPPDVKCCPGNGTSGQARNKLCLPISVPEEDPFYGRFGVKCLEFKRSLAGLRPNCVLGPRVHQNAITAPIDANFVYGSSAAMANNLRLFKGGKLRSRDWFKKQGLKPLLPPQEVEPDLECIGRPKNLFCFLAGDVRANEQTHLTVLHTLYMRDHNRMAHRLGQLNPHWNDDRIYHETRHIMAATVQNALLNEYLPLLIGQKMCHLYNLTQSSRGDYWRGYDPTVTTSVSNSFAAAAFRQGHTFIQGTVDKYNKYHQFIASERLRHLFKQPFLLYEPGVLDQLTSGLINQPTQSYDPFMSEDISGHLFQQPKQEFGHDLPAINLQRGREQGLPGYNIFREWCGLPRAETFHDLEPFLTNKTAFLYSRLYKHVDDIDLWSGGVSERKLPGAAIGPTFACIIARQFSNTRRGDKYWFENPGFASSFTPDQLIELRKSNLAKLLCENSDDLPTIQRWALRMPHPVLNPRTACEDIPDIDLRYWQEDKHTGHYYNSRA